MADNYITNITLEDGTTLTIPVVPEGGTTKQILTKNSDTDYDVSWKPVDLSTCISITYDELVALKTAGNLHEGTYYRITDYVTTTNGNSATRSEPSRSAGHQFDVVIQAIGSSDLSQIGTCALHEGDKYFANSNLSAWQIWYDIDNNASKYDWAVTDGTGKGVIYRMIDEFQNDLPYDFKNIQFYRDKTLDKYKVGVKYFSADDSYYYTFWDSKNKRDLSITKLISCSNNTIESNTILTDTEKSLDNTIFILNNIVLMTGVYNNGNTQILSNTFKSLNSSSTFGGLIMYNTIGAGSYSNVFLTQVKFTDNTLGVFTRRNTCGDKLIYAFNSSKGAIQDCKFPDCEVIDTSFGYYTKSNTFTYSLYYCKLGANFQNNTVDNCQYFTCGGNCKNNTIGVTRRVTIGDGIQYVTTSAGKSSAPSLQNLTIQSGIAGTSSAPLDLTNIPNAPLGKPYNKEIRYGSGGQVQVIWTSPEGITKGYYKDSASATEWKKLNPTMSVDTWDE